MAIEQIGLQAVLDDENFQAGLKRYNQGVSQMEKITKGAASTISAIGSVASTTLIAGLGAATVAFGALTAAATKGIGELQQWGEGIDKLGDQFGLTGEKAGGFAFLASKVGAPVDELGFALNSLTNGLQGVQDRIKSGSKTISPFEKAISQLGISALKSNGKLKTFDELLPELMDAFKKLPPGIKASSVAMDIFGTRGGGKMLDFLRQGSAGLKDATAKAKLYGLELSGDLSDAVEEFGFSQNELGLAIKGVWVTFGKAVLPVAKSFVDLIIKNMPRVTELAKKVGDAFTAIVHGFSTRDWFPIFDILDKTFGRDTANKIGTFILAIQGLADAFQTKGLAGAIDEFGRLLNKAFAGFDLAKSLGDIGGKVAGAISTAWIKISPELAKWSTRFWDWLTGKGGALDQVSTQLGKLGTAIVAEFNKQMTALSKWASSPEGQSQLTGAGESIGTALVEAIKGILGIAKTGIGVSEGLQSGVGKAADAFINIGVAIGKGIVSGIIKGVNDEFNKIDWFKLMTGGYGTGANMQERLQKDLRSLGDSGGVSFVDGLTQTIPSYPQSQRIGLSIMQSFQLAQQTSAPNVQRSGQASGAGYGYGAIQGVSSQTGNIASAMNRAIVGSSNSQMGNAYASGANLGNSFSNGLTAALNAEVSRVMGIVNTILSQIARIQNFSNFFRAPSFDTGGFVPFDMMAKVHSGEYVLNRQQAQAFAPMLSQPVNRVNNINVSAPISGTFNAADSGSMARVAQQIADATVKAVLNAA